jgi:hypothetical protein
MQQTNVLTQTLFSILFLWAISSPFLLTSQTTLVIGQTFTANNGTPQDYIIPATGAGDLTVSLRGGDGGGNRYSGIFCDVTVKGGAGATVNATFEIGNGTWSVTSREERSERL